MEAIADDAELVSPISGRLVFRGRDDLRTLLGAVYRCTPGLRWTEEIGEGRRRVLIGGARVGSLRITDALVLDLAEDGRIVRIRPHLRPWTAVTLLALRLGFMLGRRPGIFLRAWRGR